MKSDSTPEDPGQWTRIRTVHAHLDDLRIDIHRVRECDMTDWKLINFDADDFGEVEGGFGHVLNEVVARTRRRWLRASGQESA